MNGETPLGSGAYGGVFRLEDHEPPAVIKYIHQKHQNQFDLFEKETKALQRLKHKNIVEYFGFRRYEEDGREFFGILMEYCENGSLTKWIYEPSVIYSIHTVITWAQELFEALIYLDRVQTIHRDIKPDNILVTKNFSIKLGDLGTIKFPTLAADSPSMMGTPRYMAPEAFKLDGHKQITTKSDIYAVGLVLWEIIERRFQKSKPYYGAAGNFDANIFESDLRMGTLKEVLFKECLPEVQSIVTSCTKIDPECRPTPQQALRFCLNIREAQDRFSGFDFKPYTDADQKSLLKPIGIDGSTKKLAISTDALSIAPLSLNEEANIIEEDTEEKHELLEKLLSQHEKLRAYFNGLNPTNRKIAKQEASQKIEALLEEEKFLFSEYDLMSFTAKPFKIGSMEIRNGNATEDEESFVQFLTQSVQPFANSQQPNGLKMEDFLRVAIDKDLFKQFAAYRTFFLSQLFLSSTSFGFWYLLEMVDTCLEEFKKLQQCVTRRFYFKCFFQIKAKTEWLYVSKTQGLGAGMFIEKNLLEMREFDGRWTTEGMIFTICDLEKDNEIDELHFSHLEPIDWSTIVLALKETKKRVENLLRYQFENFYPVEKLETGSEFLSKTKGLDLPICGYIFQLKNPPRHMCHHVPKCPIAGGVPGNAPDEFQLKFHSCAPKVLVDYMWLYAKTIKWFHLLEIARNRRGNPVIGVPNDDAREFLEKLDCPKYFLFPNPSEDPIEPNPIPFDLPCPVEAKDVDLLDSTPLLFRVTPGEYEKVMAYDKRFGICMINRTKKYLDLENPIKMDVTELFESRALVERREQLMREACDMATESLGNLFGLDKSTLGELAKMCGDLFLGKSASIPNVWNQDQQLQGLIANLSETLANENEPYWWKQINDF